jgi:hypothetical protein
MYCAPLAPYLLFYRSFASWVHSPIPGTSHELPLGFLKACGEPLFRYIAWLANASLEIGYFPRAFKYAKVIILPKLGKTIEKL